jgi:urease accessory protein
MLSAAARSEADVFRGNRVASRVELVVEQADGTSRRQHVYEDGALRVRFPNADNLEAVILNTAGGVAGGDRLALDIAIDEDAELTVTTAAAEKFYRSLGEPAHVDVALRIAQGGTLKWLPQEAILFDGSRLTRNIAIELGENARVVMAEAIVFGRTAMGEVMTNGQLLDRWRVRRDSKLIFADTIRLGGDTARSLEQRATARGRCAVATVFVSPCTDEQIAAVRAENFSGEVGISAWNGFALLRLLASGGEVLRGDLKLALGALGVTLPRIWMN